MNLVLERLDVTKNYVTIDSPIQFYIQVNDDTEHRVLKSPQAIQIDCRKLLSHFYMPNEPAWKLSIVYDSDLLSENEHVKWASHNVDFAGSTNSVDGELVRVDLTDLYTHLQDNNSSLIEKILLVNDNLTEFKGINLQNETYFRFDGKFRIFDKPFTLSFLAGLDSGDYDVYFIIKSEPGLVYITNNNKYITIFPSHNVCKFHKNNNSIDTTSNSLVPKTYTAYNSVNPVRVHTFGQMVEVNNI